MAGTRDGNFVLVKYDGSGNKLWERVHEEPYAERLRALEVDQNGNAYLLGISYHPDSNYDSLLVKYDLNGDFVGKSRFNGPDNKYDSPRKMVLKNGSVYVIGSSFGTNGYDIKTIKYNTTPAPAWTGTYNDQTANKHDLAGDLAVSSAGSVFMSGMSVAADPEVAPADREYYFFNVVVKYDASGSEVWKYELFPPEDEP